MMPKKKGKNYIPILDQPIEVLKKPMGQPIDFDATMTQILSYKKPKKKRNK